MTTATTTTATITTGAKVPTIQRALLTLYGAGLNVTPMPWGAKRGLRWRRVQYSRHHPSYLSHLFEHIVNIAVICGHTSGNLFALDCETPDALWNAIFELRQRGIPVWAAQSGRGGHIYLRCKEGEVANMPAGTDGLPPGIEIRGHSCYVIAPPSLHPTGALYTWLAREGDAPPVVSFRDIDWLPLRLRRHRQRRKRTPRPETLEYARNGANTPKGQRHNRYWDAIRDAAWTEDESLIAAVKDAARASGLGDDGDTRVVERLEHHARHGAARRLQHGVSRCTPAWRLAALWAEQHTWSGRTATTDSAVFAALIERCRLDAGDDGVFRASLREIQKLARISKRNSVAASLRRLESEGLIKRTGFRRGSGASLWRFSIDEKVTSIGATPQTRQSVSGNLSVYKSVPNGNNGTHPVGAQVADYRDTVERGAIGLIGARIHAALLVMAAPASLSEIVRAAGVTRSQARYHLRADGWLRQSGLVVMTGARKAARYVAYPADDTVLADIAVRSGASERARRRRQRIVEERQLWTSQWVLEDLHRYLERQQRRRKGRKSPRSSASKPSRDRNRQRQLLPAKAGSLPFQFSGRQPAAKSGTEVHWVG